MKSDEWIQETADGVSLLLRVIPRSGVTKVAGLREGRLLIRLAAPPVEGAANDALISFLSKALQVPTRNIRLASGARTRDKHVTIAGMSAAQVSSALLDREPGR